jgi:hypothetical protein
MSVSAYTPSRNEITRHQISQPTPEQQASRDITRMLITTSFLYIVGNLPITVTYMVAIFSGYNI